MRSICKRIVRSRDSEKQIESSSKETMPLFLETRTGFLEPQGSFQISLVKPQLLCLRFAGNPLFEPETIAASPHDPSGIKQPGSQPGTDSSMTT